MLCGCVTGPSKAVAILTLIERDRLCPYPLIDLSVTFSFPARLHSFLYGPLSSRCCLLYTRLQNKALCVKKLHSSCNFAYLASDETEAYFTEIQ